MNNQSSIPNVYPLIPKPMTMSTSRKLDLMKKLSRPIIDHTAGEKLHGSLYLSIINSGFNILETVDLLRTINRMTPKISKYATVIRYIIDQVIHHYSKYSKQEFRIIHNTFIKNANCIMKRMRNYQNVIINKYRQASSESDQSNQLNKKSNEKKSNGKIAAEKLCMLKLFSG